MLFNNQTWQHVDKHIREHFVIIGSLEYDESIIVAVNSLKNPFKSCDLREQ